MPWKKLAAFAAIFAVGAVAQNYTGLFQDYLSRAPVVYSKPFWYSVTRSTSVIRYQAEGERYLECAHRAPLTADFRDKFGSVISRELVRKSIPHPLNPNDPAALLPSIEDHGLTPSEQSANTIIGTPQVPKEPRKFKLDNYVIVTDQTTLAVAADFIIRAECYNPINGRMLGTFGPFPVPKDGESIGYFPDVLKQPSVLPQNNPAL
jgi:hypothetical protein